MKTTVIIITWNRIALLPHAIASLLRQVADVDLDVLVVDDGSTDGTAAYLEGLASREPRVRHVHRENGGISAARNTGLDHLMPETAFVSFLDSDDLSPPGRFAIDLACFAGDPDLEVTYGRMLVTDRLDPAVCGPAEGAKSAFVTGIQLGCAVFRRSLVDRIGGFDIEMAQGEDIDYLLRIFETGTKFRQTDTVCVHHLRHAGNITRNGAANRRAMFLATAKSLRRRKANPALSLDRPTFEIGEMKIGGIDW